MKLQDSGETALVKRIKNKVKKEESIIVGIGDDCAVLPWNEKKFLLFASDMLIEGVHFTLKSAMPRQIGHKALAVNISDVAAMGGVPKYAVISLGLPRNLKIKFIDEFYKGLLRLASRFSMHIVGGDTNRSEKIVVDVAIIGEVKKENLVRRDTARIGDVICVTGSLGGSRFGRHLDFVPRLKEAQYLVSRYKINSMIDLSDGLAMDLNRITKASRCGALINAGSIPVAKRATLKDALYEGEDFELLFTLSPKEARCLLNGPIRGVAVTKIGEIKPPRYGIKIEDKSGRKMSLEPRGFNHF